MDFLTFITNLIQQIFEFVKSLVENAENKA